MEPVTIIAIVVCGGLLIALTAIGVRGSRAERQQNQELVRRSNEALDLADKLESAADAIGARNQELSASEEIVAEMRAQLEESQRKLAKSERARRDAERRAEAIDRKQQAQFGQIQKACHQRDAIMKMYREHAASAGNLQDLLLREISRLGKFMRMMAEKHGFDPMTPSDELLAACGKHAARHRDEKAAQQAIDEDAAALDAEADARMAEARLFGELAE